VQAAGADDFVSKSFKPEQLQARVKKLLAGRA
jgi:DNA-binding response OmpR family regulator